MDRLELKDIADDLLIINKTTIDRLFQEKNYDTMTLYMFYYKTAKWQNINPIKASDEYVRKCLHWGKKKIIEVKKRLKDMGLITVEKSFNEKHQLDGWYIRVGYYYSSGTESRGTTSPLVADWYTNTIDNNKGEENIINNIKENTNNKLLVQKKPFKKPTLEEVKSYCIERNNNVDYEAFYDYYTIGDWKDSKGNPVKNWKQKIITWEKKDKQKVYKTKQQLLDEEMERWVREGDKKNDKNRS